MFGREEVTRQIMGNVPSWLGVMFYSLAALACAAAAAGFALRWKKHRSGRPDTRSGSRPSERANSRIACWQDLLRYVLFQPQLRRDPLAGAAHLLVFYGFLILFWGTCLVFLEHDTPLHFFYGWFYNVASLIVDLGGVAFLAGLAIFLWRRHVSQQPALLRTGWVAALAWLLAAIGVTGFLLEGARIARELPEFERWSGVGYAVAVGLRTAGLGGETALGLHRGLWMLHALLCVCFFALLPWKFFGHMVYSLASWARRSVRPLSQLKDSAAEVAPGVLSWRDFTANDLLQADACTTCGRCVSACPANAAGKPLQPRSVVLAVRAAMDAGPEASPSQWVSDDTLWSCTTCAACNEACPVGIDVYGKIIEQRRGRVEQGIVPEQAEQLFERLAEKQNPFGRPNSQRLEWARGLDLPIADDGEPIELLYWVGCAGSFDPDGQAVARAMITILQRLKVHFNVLGARERCTGDPARRLGEEGLYREQAAANIKLLARHRVGRIMTHCPHCFNAFRNEYPQLADGAAWSVVHHSEFLAEMIAQQRLPLAATTVDGGRVTFHDPCYLGRGNGVTDAPRAALRAATAEPLVEMPRNRAESFCCGAGGGAMWVDVAGSDRVENIRAREAAATGASTVATGCPFCKVMLRTALESQSARPPRVRDLAELIAEQLEAR